MVLYLRLSKTNYAVNLINIYLVHGIYSNIQVSSVVDPGCLSRIPDPNFSIPDPGSESSILTQKIDSKLSEINDPGCSSRILIFYSSSIPDRGVKKSPDPGSGSATLLVSLSVN